ncbi:cation efflux protein [Canariomyces notabilis]|uniref:Cation efflux protein n=1 Tax=Canariomyces notabilis TaxID=2074819 RepID=A0AAN6T979_9PEZI|nr:cation efflux protein [Canariomyces arenarius]
MVLKLRDRQRVAIAIAITFSFFVCELIVAFKTQSLALMADAFHYLTDLLGLVVTLTAIFISERPDSPQDLSFGWQRARLLGAFFNGAFLLALGVSILLQSIERFISVREVEDVKLVLIMGSIGLVLNIISVVLLHGKHTLNTLNTPKRDLGMVGAMLHVVGDALNNVAVITAGAIIWFTSSPMRFYADPAVSMAISVIIFLSALSLVKKSGRILLQSAPRGVNLADVKHDIEKIPGIESVHELHVWQLDQLKAIASAHVTVSDSNIDTFMEKAKTIGECLHAYGIHSTTLQPEIMCTPLGPGGGNGRQLPCQVMCGKGKCEELMCCSTTSIVQEY